MKKQFLRQVSSFVLLVGLFGPVPIMAQVTIGSSYRPLQGALLDLKEKESINGEENSIKGLLLPRVELKTLTPATGKLSESINGTGIWAEDMHTGLLVYNVGSKDLCDNSYQAGVYTWNGSQWILIGEDKQPKVTTSQAGISQPNSYMISGKGTLTIPVAKAFAVWDGVSWKDDSGNAVLTAKTFTGTEAMSAEVVWMDGKDVITDISISSATVSSSATIQVNSGACGNAVVALKVGGDILWSWHIWVTPAVASVAFNGHTWMDRNMGAISSSVANSLSKGLSYQWGRKDPFASNTSGWTNTEPTLYKLDGTNVSVNKSTTVGGNDEANLKMAIQSPLSFISSNVMPYDWYSQTQSVWNSRWGHNSTKSVSDPCPEGWRVPDYTVNPWNGLQIGSATDFATNKGWKWSTAGFYPASGYRSSSNGDLKVVGSRGYYWTAQASLGLAKGMYFDSATIYTSASGYRADGFSIRCVAE